MESNNIGNSGSGNSGNDNMDVEENTMATLAHAVTRRSDNIRQMQKPVIERLNAIIGHHYWSDMEISYTNATADTEYSAVTKNYEPSGSIVFDVALKAKGEEQNGHLRITLAPGSVVEWKAAPTFATVPTVDEIIAMGAGGWDGLSEGTESVL